MNNANNQRLITLLREIFVVKLDDTMIGVYQFLIYQVFFAEVTSSA